MKVGEEEVKVVVMAIVKVVDWLVWLVVVGKMNAKMMLLMRSRQIGKYKETR